MLPRGSSLILAIAATFSAVYACIALGGAMSGLAVALCAFLLMVGSPIAILAWFGSLPDLDARRRAKHRQVKIERSQAQLWRRTLLEAEPTDWPLQQPAPLSVAATVHLLGKDGTRRPLLDRVAAASARLTHEGKRIKRSILALCLSAAAAAGLSGCGVPPEAWAAVRPGMDTTELVNLVGGPDYVRSNGTGEVWQYCRDFPGRDEGRYARYYTAVFVNNQQVKDVRPYPALSDAGCMDYYRANFYFPQPNG